MNKYNILLSFLLIINISQAYKVGIIGSGYVGLVTSCVLSEFGHDIICADIDQNKINKLNNYKLPIHEPGLNEIIFKNMNKNIAFTTNIEKCVQNSEIIFIAVGTPMGSDGHADLRALNSVVESIFQNLNNEKIICIKSTVPISTTKQVEKIISNNKKYPTHIIFNPEFLREGCALTDFFDRNPIVLGSNSEKAIETFKNLYKPLIDKGLSLIVTDTVSAETIKYAWNSFSAIKLSYINELDSLCKKTGSNIFDVIKGMSFSDGLIPAKNIIPGPGYGGSCLPKDTSAFVNISKKLFNFNLNMVKAAIKSNESRKKEIIDEVMQCLKNIPGENKSKTVSILGLSFKANTDDIRNSIALDLIKVLIDNNIKVKAFDPAAIENVRHIFPNVEYFNNIDKTIEDSEGVVLLTEWNVIKNYDKQKIKNNSKIKFIVDPRFLWNKL